MFSLITWGQYFTTIILVLICYYILIGIRYYSWEILNLIGIKKVDDSSPNTIALSKFQDAIVPEDHQDVLYRHTKEIDISPLVQSFTDEVHAYLQEVDLNQIEKSELLNSLYIIALKYPALKDADCRDELTQLILNTANKQYPNLLHSNEVDRMWK